MNRIQKKLVLPAAALLSIFTAEAQKQPNIIVILMDDMGYGDIGTQGAIGYETPNLDKMANEGMRFTRFYSVQAVSGASRAGLLTGCYPNRIGFSGAPGPDAVTGIKVSLQPTSPNGPSSLLTKTKNVLSLSIWPTPCPTFRCLFRISLREKVNRDCMAM